MGLIVLTYIFRTNLSYAYSSVILDNQDTILFECSEFGDEEELLQIRKGLPTSDPELYSLLKEISVYDDSDNIDEIIMITSTNESFGRCPGKYQFEILFFGHEDRVQLNRYLIDGKLHGIPVFLRNI